MGHTVKMKSVSRLMTVSRLTSRDNPTCRAHLIYLRQRTKSVTIAAEHARFEPTYITTVNVRNYLSRQYGRKTIPVAAPPKAWIYRRLLAGIAGSNPAGLMDVCRDCYMLSGRGLCDGSITRLEQSYRTWRVWVLLRHLTGEPNVHQGLSSSQKKKLWIGNNSKLYDVLFVKLTRLQMGCSLTYCIGVTKASFTFKMAHSFTAHQCM